MGSLQYLLFRHTLIRPALSTIWETNHEADTMTATNLTRSVQVSALFILGKNGTRQKQP